MKLYSAYMCRWEVVILQGWFYLIILLKEMLILSCFVQFMHWLYAQSLCTCKRLVYVDKRSIPNLFVHGIRFIMQCITLFITASFISEIWVIISSHYKPKMMPMRQIYSYVCWGDCLSQRAQRNATQPRATNTAEEVTRQSRKCNFRWKDNLTRKRPIPVTEVYNLWSRVARLSHGGESGQLPI